MDIKFRKELKYRITYAEYLSIRQRVKAVMKKDSHTKDDGTYLIRSIYFDNYQDKALKEKIDGQSQREKFRIRYYNDDFSYITLEKKTKLNNMGKKFYTVITKDELEKILNGDYEWMIKSTNPLIQEFYVKLKENILRPVVLVSYTREPYTFSAGNVRITFDSNIRSSMNTKDFLNPEVLDISATEEEKDILMEVKYTGFLPDIIRDIIQGRDNNVQAFSKYCACRLVNN